MEHKRITAEIKGDGDEGLVTARFGTSGVKDLDGDVIEAGAIGVQEIQVSQFGHTSWMGGLPVGKGTTREDGDEMLADLAFFMDTTGGRDHFATIKALGDLGQWSFGFEIKESRAPTEDERQLGIERILQKLEVFEVSPVRRASGINTQTVDAKCHACGAEVRPAKGADPDPDPKVKPPDPATLPGDFSAEVARAELFKAKHRQP